MRSKQERSDRYDPSILDKLEASIPDLDTRVQVAMRDTARDRRTAPDTGDAASSNKKKKKGGFFSRILGGGGDATSTTTRRTVGRGRTGAFQEGRKRRARQLTRTARALFGVVRKVPDSEISVAKLAIATLIPRRHDERYHQAGQQIGRVTFFHATSGDDVMIRVEVEMRRMGLPTARGACAQARSGQGFLQQFRSGAPDRRRNQVARGQENLAMHN